MQFLTIYGRVLGLLKPERRLAIMLALANVGLAGVGFLEPLLFGRIIDVLAMPPGSPGTWEATIQLLALWAGAGLTGIVAGIMVALHSDRLAHRRRLAALASYFEHVLSLPVAFHAGTHSATLLKIMLQGGDNLFGMWLSFFREHLSTFVAVLVLLPLSLYLNWRLGILLVVLIFIFAGMSTFVVHKAQRAQGEVEAYYSELATRAYDALGNVVLVQSFVRLALEARDLAGVMERLLAAQFPVLNLWALMTVLSRMAATVTTISIFVLGSWLHSMGEASVGQIVSFMGFATMLIGRLENAMGFISNMFFQMHKLKEFFDVLDTESAVRNKPDAAPLDHVRGDVAFENVTLSYNDARQAVIDMTFDVPAGRTVALVGPTGSGKTSSMALLSRLWDPQAGVIRIDGVDIRDVTLDSLRSHIGVVFQDSAVFHRSIADNIRIGRPEASDAEVEAAARNAEAHDFIMRQPDGYATLVGERGVNLSGGERQRLAIARALLKNPPILILDEATSALDAATEKRIQKALDTLMQGRTTFIIAHRLATVRQADLVLVLQNGRIIERGTFDELAGQGGLFAELVRTQFAGAH